VGGEDGAKLKALYEKYFKPGLEYQIDEDRCVLLEDADDDEEDEDDSLDDDEAYACENCGAEFRILADAEKHEAICMAE